MLNLLYCMWWANPILVLPMQIWRELNWW